ncbi:MAG TPA: hypothetical protein VKX28_15330 [Xanthobacteraceae bacterium]|nr:hypothetical protein [Xanthobacteraceae bacterium]
MLKSMLLRLVAMAFLALPCLLGGRAHAQLPITPPQVATDVSISWEVRNRFRLFRDEKDFNRHLAAESGTTILAAEQTLAQETDGRGWARDMVTRLCVDGSGHVLDSCMRDGVRESYLDPVDHRVTVRLTGAVPADASCAWSFDNGQGPPQTLDVGCGEPVNLRALYGRTTKVTVDVTSGGVTRQTSDAIDVRDLLIAGLGDSIASGEGDPDRPVALSDDGFCFRNFLATGRKDYFRPGRVGFNGDKACDATQGGGSNMAEWARLSARWMSSACHRSLYSYQLRAALGLAVENPHIAVTFLPLACTGATIETGLFGTQRARELNCGEDNGGSCPTTIPGQITQLRVLLEHARRTQPGRKLDLVFLTVGANDVYFAGLVADVIIDSTAERLLARRGGIISTLEDAQSQLTEVLPGNFARLRAALKSLLGGSLDKVVFTSYGNPALAADGGFCPGGRDGFDVHPSFNVNGERLRRATLFVQNQFLPGIKALATCAAGVRCGAGESMAFADAHQAAFAQHGFCAHSDADPDFDRECFKRDGTSFTNNLVEGATDPMTCDLGASEFRAYASRARWIRTANDSYFTAMTFPEGLPSTMQPADLHDATWGILSAVYGGAVHPTAEGYAAMADAALGVARVVLKLGPAVEPVKETPLPPPVQPQAPGLAQPAPQAPPAVAPPAALGPDDGYTPAPPPQR